MLCISFATLSRKSKIVGKSRRMMSDDEKEDDRMDNDENGIGENIAKK